MRTCSSCGQSRPLTAFYVHRHRRIDDAISCSPDRDAINNAAVRVMGLAAGRPAALREMADLIEEHCQ